MSSVSQIYFNKKCDQVTLEDIQKLIDDNVTENYTLDYKALTKKPKHGNYGKVISSFLNTNGGLLVIGVSEKDHKYPDKITWGKISRETLVQNLYNIVDPWSSDIGIKPIENPEDENERLFVVDVPKSKNPPHMANGVYYYRNVFESIPMSHPQVKGIFTESHLLKEKMIERVIEPIYLNVMAILEKNNTTEYYYGETGFSGVLSNDRYLYDQLNNNLKKRIEHFFHLVKIRDDTRGELRYFYSDCLKRNIVDLFLGTVSLEEIRNKVDLLEMRFEWSQGLRPRRSHPDLLDCIIYDKSPFFEADENPIEKFQSEIKGYKELTRDEFLDLFIQLKRQIRESRSFSKWVETNTEIEKNGEELVKILRSY